MYIGPGQYGTAFAEIKRTSSSHSTCKLILFVACLSVDSICTAKIFAGALKKNLIQYQLIPVSGYADLKEHYAKLDDDVTNVVLIGCGAMIDLEAFFEIDPAEYVSEPAETAPELGETLPRQYKRKIYVVDGARPWNLDNLFGLELVVCFDDGFIDKHLDKERASYTMLVEMDSDAEDAEDAEDDAAEPPAEGGNSDTDHDSDTDTESEKKRRLPGPGPSRKRQKHDSEEVLENYYNQGTALFTAASAIVYALLATIGETSLDNLWLAIIGVLATDRHHPEVYDKMQPLFAEEVQRLSPSDPGERLADLAALVLDTDYHLFLLRHWTLYDLFFYSGMVNSKLNLWREDGKKKLHKMLAKMGISLSVAQQKWLYMDISVKRNLPVIFAKYLPLFGLDGLVRPGFLRMFGYAGLLSAMECVEALLALLENASLQGLALPTAPDSLAALEAREKVWVANFWSLWDALNMAAHTTASQQVISGALRGPARRLKGYDLLLHGLEQAKHVQQTVFRTGLAVLERRLLKNLRLYRLCVLHDNAIPDLAVFGNPLLLARLGNWLLENINEAELALFMEKKTLANILKPLVVAALDHPSDTYLVIGLAPKYPRGIDNSTRARLAQTQGEALVTRLNTFSVAFQKVAATLGAKVRINSFDSAVIEIRKDDLLPFLEKLTLSGLL